MSGVYDRVLIPTDGSEHAATAVDHALALGRTFDATVHAIHVVDTAGESGVFGTGASDESVTERLETAGESALDAVRETATAEDDLETELVHGEPTETIVDYAEEIDADVLVMGTHGRTGVRRYVAGSVTEGVVRHAAAPVLTVRADGRETTPGSFDEVLLPTDGSPAAEAAVEHGLTMAGIADARVHVLNVVDVSDTTGGASASVATDLVDQLRESGQTAVDRVAAVAREAGFETTTSVVEGFPARDVLHYAEESGVDLIAMGSHGRTGVSRFLLGSTTERAIRHADVPVLAVNTRHLSETELADGAALPDPDEV